MREIDESVDKWLEWLFDAEQAVCDHKEWVSEGYGGPDSGSMGGYCPHCHYSFNVTLY